MQLFAIILVVAVAAANAHSVSLRTTVLSTENEPYQVFVAAAGASFEFGAGVPVTRRHVLTVASLVRGYSSWNIGYGSNSFGRLQYIETNVAFMHPLYNGNTFNNNLAIIVLPTSLPRGLVRPIQLPAEADRLFPRINHEGRLVGFGMVNESTPATKSAPNASLKTVFLTVTNNCTSHFANTDASRNFCASEETADSMNLCRGDVGNAFVVMRRGEPVLAGLTSIVSKSCKSGEATSFLRVQAYLPWINRVISNAELF